MREGSSVRQFGRPSPFRIRHRRRRRNMKIQRQSIHKTLSYNNTWSLLFRPHSLSLTGRILLFEYESATLLTVYNRTGHNSPEPWPDQRGYGVGRHLLVNHQVYTAIGHSVCTQSGLCSPALVSD